MNKKTIPEYLIWKAMKARCYSPSNKDVGNYQADNIKVCKRWLNDFELFYADMGSRPTSNHSIDRIDNTKDYSPENCRWTTQDVQCKNRGSFNLLYTYNGETLVLKDWARKLNINYYTLWNRISRKGLAFEEAIKTDPYKRLVEINGDALTVKEWCKKLNLYSGSVYCRISHGMSPKEALLKPFTKKRKRYGFNGDTQEETQNGEHNDSGIEPE